MSACCCAGVVLPCVAEMPQKERRHGLSEAQVETTHSGNVEMRDGGLVPIWRAAPDSVTEQRRRRRLSCSPVAQLCSHLRTHSAQAPGFSLQPFLPEKTPTAFSNALLVLTCTPQIVLSSVDDSPLPPRHGGPNPHIFGLTSAWTARNKSYTIPGPVYIDYQALSGPFPPRRLTFLIT